MKSKLRMNSLCLLLVGCTLPSFAIGQRRANSPIIDDDGKVTFRIRAAEAEAVELFGQWPNGHVNLNEAGNGVWQVEVNAIPAGVWEYSFRVDGLSMIDPGNAAIKPMRSPRTSILHLPSEPPALHDFRDVEHGTVHSHTYHSSSLNRRRELVVYTPPGYDTEASTRYPTLYLQHGNGDNQATWTVHGKAHWILDNLIAEKKAVPMVIVMMDGHASLPGEARGTNTEKFEMDLLKDVLPYVEQRYRVATESNQRAIAGLSMGGGQSLAVGLNHPDKFAWVGSFSAATPKLEETSPPLKNSDATNQKLELLWIACGKEDFLLDRNELFVRQLKENHVDHVWKLTEGNHSWPIWREYLAQFAPQLFQ